MSRINFGLDELQAFVVTAEKASFRAAAEALFLSQPALSRRVDKLEAALGERLLERTTRRVALTAVGAEFLAEARVILDGLEDAVLRLGDRAHLRRGRVTVACVPSVAHHLLPGVLKRFADLHPAVRVRLIDESAATVLEAVANGEADFGLSFLGAQEPGLRFTPVAQETYVLAMPRQHPWARRAGVAWAELAGERLVAVSRQSGNRVLIDQALANLPERPVAWYECNHVTGALSLVEAGLGLAALPHLALPPEHPQLCGVPLTDPTVHRTVGLLQRLDRELSPAAAALQALLPVAGASPTHPAKAADQRRERHRIVTKPQ